MSTKMTFEETAYDMADRALGTAYNSIEQLMGSIADGKVGDAEMLKELESIALSIVTGRKNLCTHNQEVLGKQFVESRWNLLHEQGCALARSTSEVMARYQQAEEKGSETTIRSLFR